MGSFKKGPAYQKRNPKRILKKNEFHCYSFILRLPRPWDLSRSLRNAKRFGHAKYGGLSSSIRREKAKILLFVDVCFVICCIFEVFSSSTPHICSPTIVKSFQDNLFDHNIHTEHILYGYMSRKHQFQQPTFLFF